MTKNFKIYIPLFLFLLGICFSACGQEKTTNYITFIQGVDTIKISKNTDSMFIERKPFSIRFFCKQYETKKEKHYAAQIAVLDSPSDTMNLKFGQDTKNITFFEPGTGMAPGENERYDKIFITNSAHHYLFYENEKERRVNLISKHGKLLELEWEIFEANYQNQTAQFSDLNLPYLYFVVFIDNNLNDVLNKGDWKIIKVIFK